MSLIALSALVLVLAGLAAVAYGPEIAARVRSRAKRPAARPPVVDDPGRERRAERRAEELLRSVVNQDEYRMYRELGFIHVAGAGGSGYGYLIYPHKPVVAYMSATGELLNEYCIEFPDRTDPEAGTRLPAADDVLAKWMALRSGERDLIDEANMHLPGRQLDPDRVRRDLRRLAEWRGRRAA